MIRTGLDFAQGTTDDSKRHVGRLIRDPRALLSAYRTARELEQTSDIVLVASDQSPDILGGSRAAYVQHLRQAFGPRAAEFQIYSRSAHQVATLPSDSEAMWLVIDVKGADFPVMCVIYGIPYEVQEGVAAN